MYYLKPECPVCGTISLSIRVCGGEDEEIIVLCEECDAIWLEPDLSGEPYFPEEHNMLCPSGKGTIASPESYWANEAQIKAKGWWKFIAYVDGQPIHHNE
jgi:hypothetical protein